MCQQTDAFVEAEVAKVFNSKKTKKLERGIAFPTCVSCNNVVGHFSPFADDSKVLAAGDVAKIVCGAHIDGFAATAATTVIVGGGKTSGRKADVVLAAHHAMMAAQRLIKEGATNHAITDAMNKICEDYTVNMVEGVLSHTIKKHCVDGNNVIMSKETPSNSVDEWIFKAGDVIGMDVYVSSGEGKPKNSESRTTVYKREVQNMYSLKLNKSRQFFAECNKRFPSLPFALRAFEDSTGAKVGVKECLDHDLVIPYPVLEEKEGETVAHFHCTVAVLPKSTAVLAGNLPFKAENFEGEHKLVNADMVALVASDLWKREDKKSKK